MADVGEHYFVCGCFFVKNYFIQRLGRHFCYTNRSKFISDYNEILLSQCTEDEVADILNELEEEKQRRLNLGSQSLARMKEIQTSYKPLHPYLFNIQENIFHQEFLKLVALCQNSNVVEKSELKAQFSCVKNGSRIFSFPVFTKQFCSDLVEELLNFEDSDLPKGRPNTMNNYGILLDEIGFDQGLLNPLREKYLAHIAGVLFPDWGGDHLDSHKAFVVKYKVGEDTSLSYHYDNAEVTLNVSLGGDYDDGSLYFGNMREEEEPHNESGYVEYVHKETIGLLHRGQHKHGAMPITRGTRFNLIMWMRSSAIRNKKCPMCDEKPSLVETIGRGDGFKLDPVEVCSLT